MTIAAEAKQRERRRLATKARNRVLAIARWHRRAMLDSDAHRRAVRRRRRSARVAYVERVRRAARLDQRVRKAVAADERRNVPTCAEAVRARLVVADRKAKRRRAELARLIQQQHRDARFTFTTRERFARVGDDRETRVEFGLAVASLRAWREVRDTAPSYARMEA